jgi:ADP-ribose pyrophosphatase YjhB (NUDIX family)
MEVERPSDEELARLEETYGRPVMRSFHWDHRGTELTKDYPDCKGEAVLLIWDEERGLAVCRPAGAPMDHWVIPMGRVWATEVFEEGARREAREETGLEIEILAIPAIHVCTLLFKNERLERWYLICRAAATGGTLDPQEPEEMAESRFEKEFMSLKGWRRSDWYGSVLRDGGLSGPQPQAGT